MSLGRVLNMVAFMVRLYRLPTGRLPRPDAIVVSSPSLFPILPPSGGRVGGVLDSSSRSETCGP